jgi:RNA polymerase sigma-70 factor (ECF subfamily)
MQGDQRAFAELVERYQRVLFNLAARIVSDPEDARDLTQTVFVKAYRNLGSFDQDRRFFSWIYRIMINESLSLVRRRRPQEPLNEFLLAPGRTPEEHSEQEEAVRMVRSAVMELSAEHRDAIVLRHFLHFSHREISEALSVPEKTVKSRLHSARQRLVQILGRHGIQSA